MTSAIGADHAGAAVDAGDQQQAQRALSRVWSWSRRSFDRAPPRAARAASIEACAWEVELDGQDHAGQDHGVIEEQDGERRRHASNNGITHLQLPDLSRPRSICSANAPPTSGGRSRNSRLQAATGFAVRPRILDHRQELSQGGVRSRAARGWHRGGRGGGVGAGRRRPAEPALTAVAGPAGARLLTSLDASAGLRRGSRWPSSPSTPRARTSRASTPTSRRWPPRLGRATWPVPVALPASEAAAWRALGLGLVPARGRLVALDPAMPEAAVVDRDGDLLASAGAVVTADRRATRPPPAAEDLVALARQALDAAPAGPPFAGALIAGALPAVPPGGEELPAVVARRTGHPPLLAGDPRRALSWGPPLWAGRPRPLRPRRRPRRTARRGARRRSPRRRPRPRSSQPLRPVPGRSFRPGAGAGGRHGGSSCSRCSSSWQARPACSRGVLAPQPSPYTHTCPGDVVVAYSAECDKLAPSSLP